MWAGDMSQEPVSLEGAEGEVVSGCGLATCHRNRCPRKELKGEAWELQDAPPPRAMKGPPGPAPGPKGPPGPAPGPKGSLKRGLGRSGPPGAPGPCGRNGLGPVGRPSSGWGMPATEQGHYHTLQLSTTHRDSNSGNGGDVRKKRKTRWLCCVNSLEQYCTLHILQNS